MLKFIKKEPAKNQKKSEIWTLSQIYTFEKMRVLEIDCGSGEILNLLSQKLTNSQILGSDSSAKNVKLAKELNADAVKSGWLEVVKAAPSNLPFKDEKFDLILALSSVSSWKNFARYFNEAKRLLKKGGKIYLFVDVSQFSSQSLANARMDEILDVFASVGFVGRGAISHENKKWNLLFATK